MSQSERAAADMAIRRMAAELERSKILCSVGIALFPHDAADAAGLFTAADRALYESKQAGKNTHRFFGGPKIGNPEPTL
ncbi:MAG: hypothetical protein NVSMB64_03540 [Candidatus Velthaea sp.]